MDTNPRFIGDCVSGVLAGSAVVLRQRRGTERFASRRELPNKCRHLQLLADGPIGYSHIRYLRLWSKWHSAIVGSSFAMLDGSAADSGRFVRASLDGYRPPRHEGRMVWLRVIDRQCKRRQLELNGAALNLLTAVRYLCCTLASSAPPTY